MHYRVWAPEKTSIDAVLFADDGKTILRTVPLQGTPDGYFHGDDRAGRQGDLYKFRLDDNEGQTFPDPASRFQPLGVHGPSQVRPQGEFTWLHDAGRHAVKLEDLVVYELHVGTFTPGGTFRAAIQKLDALQELGVTAIELMPLADFPGRWNWGYDGVFLYAPSRAYGEPDDLRALVDAAHSRRMSVILDCVYNHLGPDGAYLGAYTRSYFNPAHKTPWGDALNFDGPLNGPVREYFLGNVVYWMEEFHVDGFRLDAVHAIVDETERHVLADMAAAVHVRGGFVFAEDDRNAAWLAEPQTAGGTGLDGLWADDFHHTVRVALTGERESYLSNFTGTAEELAETLANGWFYRGQLSGSHGQARGTPCTQLPPAAFCYCISNHDQVGNRAFGERLHTACSPEGYRAASALLCLAPYTPLLFQGQEWAASTPFLFFTDHHEELGKLVTAGRRREFAGFKGFSDPESTKNIPDPQAETTFQHSKLRWEEVEEGGHAKVRALYKEALRLRREEPALGRRNNRQDWQAVALGNETVALVYTEPDRGEMCMVVCNLTGGDQSARLGIDEGPKFELIFSSNEERFGGDGQTAFNAVDGSMKFGRPELLVLRAKV